MIGEDKAKVYALSSNAARRALVEDSLNARFSEVLAARPRAQSPQTPCGIEELDDLLHGGLPIGALVELVGTPCSGRTTATLTYMATLTRQGGVVAWIDASDAMDPETMAACGVDLERLLWVRCGLKSQTSSSQQLFELESRSAMPIATSSLPLRHTGGGSPHPRSEGRDMPQAVSKLLAAHGDMHDKQTRRERRAIGTPGAPNRSLSHASEHREEQVNSDRLPPRRGENLVLKPRCAEPQPRRVASLPFSDRLPPAKLPEHRPGTSLQKPWPLLDQSLRVADLLLQGGGFSAIVLDLGSTPPEAAWRIPMATWFRFRAACERTRTSVVLLTQHPCARSSAELVIRLQTGSMEAENKVITGIRYQAITERSRTFVRETSVISIRKPPQSERIGGWRADAIWMQAK